MSLVALDQIASQLKALKSDVPLGAAAVSAGFAARIAGKPLAEMLTLLSSQGIALTGNDKGEADDARTEMRAARDWLAKHTS